MQVGTHGSSYSRLGILLLITEQALAGPCTGSVPLGIGKVGLLV